MKPFDKRIFPLSWYWPNWFMGDGCEELGLLDSLIWTIGIIGIGTMWGILLIS